MATTSDTHFGRRFEQRGVVMKLVMNMVRKPFKAGEVIFDFGEKSDDLYLIHSGSVEIVSREGLVLATLKAGELFGEMASILGERERTARAVTATNAVIDVIDSTTMRRKLGEADPVLRALVRNLTIRLADANKMNEERWLLLNVYQSLAPDEIERPGRDRAPLTSSAPDRGSRTTPKSPEIGNTFFFGSSERKSFA